LVATVLAAALRDSSACTLWGAAGDRVAGQGVIIAKNRDWKPDHTQKARMVRPRSGHRYFGLFAEGGEEPGLKAGVNIKGLTVVTASASSIPAAARKNQPGKKGVLAEILAGYDSVDDVLARRDLFAHARAAFFLIADPGKLAIVEVALDGKYAVQTETNGVVAHTNYYLDEALRSANVNVGTSSAKRLGRIRTLLADAHTPLTVDQFKIMSADQHDGPDNSLWRTGEKNRTLAAWIIELRKPGPPVLHLKIANPGQEVAETSYVLDEKFWQ
jgi:hypothetical protein